ncbi:MAG: hypothetical protein QNJ88_13355 [Acidimicrobiia bacterium]|nr:hypothetical protein [Acidimicrobiia bacterium]
MKRHAIVVLSPEDTPEGRGRILHAFTTARDVAASGAEVAVYFDGIGVTCLTAFRAQDNQFTRNYAGLFEDIRPLIAGACDFCARRRFGAAEAAIALDVEFLGGTDQHHSLATSLLDDAVVTTF